jgi:putative transposase
LATLVRSRLSLQLEIIALRHQLTVYQRSIRRPRIRPSDRILISRHWSRWREVLVFVQPATMLAWQRKRLRAHWARISRKGTPGRPTISKEVPELIRRLSSVNPLWGSPRILGELRKLGIQVAKSTVKKYRVRPSRPSSPMWRVFLDNHLTNRVSNRVLYRTHGALQAVLRLGRSGVRPAQGGPLQRYRNPTAQWTAQQIIEAFPWDTAPKYLLHDRDVIYGNLFHRRVESMGIEQVVTAPRSPWLPTLNA